MKKNTKRRGRMTKAERRRIKRRKLLLKRIAIYGIAATICVACLVLIPILNRPIDHQTSWYVEDGALEIAAPPRSETGLTTAANSFVTTDSIDDLDEGSFFSTVPIVPGDSDEPAAVVLPENYDESMYDEDEEEDLTARPVSITITAAGDCTFGGCLKHDTYKVFKQYVDDYGYDYFFANVRSLFEADDLTIINLEGPLTDVGTMTTKSGICFRGDPEWTAIMTGSSVELCNFANNHAMDMGQQGFDRTLQALDDAGIGYCAYDNVYRTTVKGVRITALGFDKWTNNQEEVVAAVQRERANCDLLIVNFHWGREMHYEPMKDQKKMGRAIIDAGGDLVIGTHPHVYGGVEQYKGKYIAYSLGNFCFGGNTMPKDQRCMIFQQIFQIDTDGSVSDGGINIIPCLVSGNPKKNDFQPYILGDQEGTALLRKISSYSNLGDDTLWMTGSYPGQVGFVKTAEVAPTATAEPEDEFAHAFETAAPTATPEPAQDFTSLAQNNTPFRSADEEIEDISGEKVEDGFALGTPDVQTSESDMPRMGEALTQEQIAVLQQQMYLEQAGQ